MSTEMVLGLSATRFTERFQFSGWRAYTPTDFDWLLDPAAVEFRPRSEVETDPTFVQIIPYVVLSWQQQIFHYTRTGGTETRLRARRSIGLGGHINPSDGVDPYRAGLWRELHEEVAFPPPVSEHILGLIYDPRTPVGQVHVGVVHRLELPTPDVTARETGLQANGFAAVAELELLHAEFETWSQFALTALAAEHG